jgi:hypothetical protein
MTRVTVTREWLFEGLTEWQATILEWYLKKYLEDDMWQ